MEVSRREFAGHSAATGFLLAAGAAVPIFIPREVRAQGALTTLTQSEAATLEAVGEAMVPGAAEAGVAHFVDQQISGLPEAALLFARIVDVPPPYGDFYRAALAMVDQVSMSLAGRRFVELDAPSKLEGLRRLRQPPPAGWLGPPPALIHFVLRSDAIDVVYGTMAGYEKLDVPYMAHIAPKSRW